MRRSQREVSGGKSPSFGRIVRKRISVPESMVVLICLLRKGHVIISLSYFQSQLAEAHFRRTAGVKLQAEDAAAGAAGVFEIDAKVAVDPGANVRADGLDLVRVPIAALH